jgi:cyclopropane-fatty-acyl-phospholipid synthase
MTNMDRRRERVWPILERTYGAAEAQRWWMRWRIFFAACAELFGHDHGQEWWVSHYLFERER